jgi:hypothetical protein
MRDELIANLAADLREAGVSLELPDLREKRQSAHEAPRCKG